MDRAQSIVSRRTIFLDQPPCCLQFCPRFPDYFVLGTYDLVENDEADQHRDGQILLCKIENDDISLSDLFALIVNDSKICQTVSMGSGILDVQMRGDMIAAATSTGAVVLLSLFTNNLALQQLEIKTRASIQIKDTSSVITSVSWSPFTEITDHPELCTTDANGDVVVVAIPRQLVDSNDENYIELSSGLAAEADHSIPTIVIQSHNLEAWVATWIPWWTAPRNGILSGGDDCYLRFTGIVEGSAIKTSEEYEVLSWDNRKLHTAGVTAILPLANGAIATGSYDDHLRVLELPDKPGQSPKLLQEIYLGGGVWRLKIIRSNRSMGSFSKGSPFEAIILVSCMFAGAYVIKVESAGDGSEWKLGLVAKFTEHESMNYGCDVQPVKAKWQQDDAEEKCEEPRQQGKRPPRNVISCSFYDKRICLWQFRE